MKKIMPIFILLAFMFAFNGCSPKSTDLEPIGEALNVRFTGVIESIDGNQWLVSTTDDVGFDKANVQISEQVAIAFNPLVGQTVSIEILPEIRESYPVQVTAVLVTLASEESSKASYIVITPEAAKTIMDSDEPYVLIDVRTKEEFETGHIPGATLLPLNLIPESALDVLPDLDQKILLYCRSGNRSETAARLLIDLGYTQVIDFGGIIDWPYEIIK